jgi:hypothetical protein
MPTNPQTGFVPARRIGSAPDNKGLSPYPIASAYGTALGKGDPVRLSSGNLVVATNGSDAIGVFDSVTYKPTGATQYIGYGHYWPASATGTGIEALVVDDPSATFTLKTDGNPTAVLVGDIYAVTVGTPDVYTGRSSCVANTLTTLTGSLAVTGTNNAALAGLANNDAFTIRTSLNGSAVTITIVTNQTPAQLLALLNAVPGITASLNGSNFLVVTANDGGNIILTDGAGTPLADSNLLATAGTKRATVAANAGMIKVTKVPEDTSVRQIEGVLVNHSLRDDG